MEPAIQQALREGELLGLRYALQIPQVAASGLNGLRWAGAQGVPSISRTIGNISRATISRFVDWGIYARTDRLSIKLFREEVTPHLDIIIDGRCP
jgi:DNA-binding transcriptional regulator YdaS (Cro superfamily)